MTDVRHSPLVVLSHKCSSSPCLMYKTLTRHRRYAGLSVVLTLGIVLPGCSFDTETPAPALETMGTPPENCGTTETVFPKLLAFIDDGRFDSLRSFVQRHLVTTEENPQPDVSTRTLVSVMLKLINSFGLDKTISLTDLASSSEILGEQKPLIMAALDFITGDLDGVSRYEVGDAGAHFIRVCDPDDLLLAAELLTAFESPSRPGEMWIDLMLKEIAIVVQNPTLDSFLEMFEKDSESGKPAIVAVIAQIMGLVRQPDFTISRVETVLESVVYPILSDDLRPNIDRMMGLLEEATNPEAGILIPLQGSIDCGMRHPTERDVIIGFLYDLLLAQDIGARMALVSVADLVSVEDSKFLLGIVSDLIASIREDRVTRDDLLEFFALILQQPDITLLLPTISELIVEGVLTELMEAIQSILGECNRG